MVQIGYIWLIQVQYITESSSDCPTVLCFFQEKEQKKKRKGEKTREKWLVAFPKVDQWLCGFLPISGLP
jgi:hypothetical protein